MACAPDNHDNVPEFHIDDSDMIRWETARTCPSYCGQAAQTFPGCVRGTPGEARTVRAKRVPQPRKEYPVRIPPRDRHPTPGLEPAEATAASSRKHNGDGTKKREAQP